MMYCTPTPCVLPTRPLQISRHRIVAELTEQLQLPEGWQLKSIGRKRDILEWRHIFLAYLYINDYGTMGEIAEWYGFKNHTTIINVISNFHALSLTSDRYADKVDMFNKIIKQIKN